MEMPGPGLVIYGYDKRMMGPLAQMGYNYNRLGPLRTRRNAGIWFA